ncbi:MAG TPA: metal-sulfur cluster assembly factor [Burkholderiales bacterium]|nr:metal-sulfur cluster assembly factor [Burkholderiales bacterium]
MPGAMTEEDALEALRAVQDPEAGMSIVDLGLVYRVEVKDKRIEVDLTMTSPACPVAPQLVDEAVAAIRTIAPEAADVEVRLVWDPPWTPERMSEAARERFGWGP